jgi:hypothetical protein
LSRFVPSTNIRVFLINTEHSDPHETVGKCQNLQTFSDVPFGVYITQPSVILYWNFYFNLTSSFISQYTFQPISRAQLFCFPNCTILKQPPKSTAINNSSKKESFFPKFHRQKTSRTALNLDLLQSNVIISPYKPH